MSDIRYSEFPFPSALQFRSRVLPLFPLLSPLPAPAHVCSAFPCIHDHVCLCSPFLTCTHHTPCRECPGCAPAPCLPCPFTCSVRVAPGRAHPARSPGTLTRSRALPACLTCSRVSSAPAPCHASRPANFPNLPFLPHHTITLQFRHTYTHSHDMWE